jgi:hypothetical protein
MAIFCGWVEILSSNAYACPGGFFYVPIAARLFWKNYAKNGPKLLVLPYILEDQFFQNALSKPFHAFLRATALHQNPKNPQNLLQSSVPSPLTPVPINYSSLF